MLRRDLLGAALGLGAAPLAARTAFAQDGWPTRTVRWMVGYGAGGTSDVLARLLGKAMTELSGQSVVVENRPSGGAIVATEVVVRAPADGYTLLQVDNGVMVYNPALYSRLPFDPDTDLVPVNFIGRFPMIVMVRKESPYRSFADLLAASKKEAVTFGTPAVASPHHLGMELLKLRSGLDATHVPFRGTPPAIQEMLAGRIDCAMIDLGNVLPLVQAGAARALVAVHEARAPALPETPTARELGYDVVAPGWQGVVVARGTQPAQVAAMDRALQAALDTPEVKAKLATYGGERLPGGPAEFAAYIRRENAAWRPLIRDLGLRMDS
ncbi:tripartite tricarboxylate transporter substrate binding protein [Roseomonas sp. NAR14]|uniref:Tripartite tricarboxylate transporter substrate binding protein n=1 Tax=Roseomonas acroporae TaxID=2937791 RepID=A0A9X1YAQ4_9PROT|nr:tripartite tricarboxylate transporter substrate binding protein [Roseomonas acroporae]MCK8785948.1 tripartite tricarboxylate transporter substrate binding protein [Roseomonas acroporae]